jgi:hypothetical protein
MFNFKFVTIMITKNLLTFTAIIAVLIGLSLILTPQTLSDLYNIDPTMSRGAIVLSRAYGSLLLGLGIALWMSRNALPSAGRRGLLLIIIISCALMAANYIHGILTGVNTNIGWSLVVLTAILALWGGLLLPKETGD